MEEAADFDVTPVQFAILHAPLEQPGEDQVTLATRVAFDAATSGSVIGRLEARGWVRREPDTQDRRRKLLWITPKAKPPCCHAPGRPARAGKAGRPPHAAGTSPAQRLADQTGVQHRHPPKATGAEVLGRPIPAPEPPLSALRLWLTMKLYNYFRSSASFRVRIALNIRACLMEYLPVHLLRGEHRDPAYANLVGDALVPALVTDEGPCCRNPWPSWNIWKSCNPPRAVARHAPGPRPGARPGANGGLRNPPAEQPPRARYLTGTLHADEDAKMPGTTTGCARAWRPLSASWHCWPPSGRRRGWPPSVYCWGDTPRWPIAAWCRKSSTASALA